MRRYRNQTIGCLVLFLNSALPISAQNVVAAHGFVTRAPQPDIVTRAPPAAVVTEQQIQSKSIKISPAPTNAATPTSTGQFRSETVAFEDFEHGNDYSWSDQRVVDSRSELTHFLGRFGQDQDEFDNTTSNEFIETSKIYQIPTLAEFVELEFDFYEIDLWCDCDHFVVVICGEEIEMGEFSQHAATDQMGTSSLMGIPWYRHATSRNVDMGFSKYRDAIHHMGLTIPQECYADGILQVTLFITIHGGYDLASGGIDNINITAYNIPSTSVSAPPSTLTPRATIPIMQTGNEACIMTPGGSGRECRPLVDKDGTHFGDVCITIANDAHTGKPSDHIVNVTYATNGDYRLTRNFLWLGNRNGDTVPIKSEENRELNSGGEELDIERFPHFSCNFAGSKIWEKLIHINPRCGNTTDRTIPLSIIAHSEVALSQRDGTVALGAPVTRAFGAQHTFGNIEDTSWYEVIHFKVDCLCESLTSSTGDVIYTPFVPQPTEAPIQTSIAQPGIVTSLAPSSTFPTLQPSAGPTPYPTLAPTYACRPVWAIEEFQTHCFKDNSKLGGSNAPYGWYNGIFHLHDVVTLPLYVERGDSGAQYCDRGMEVIGNVGVSYQKKVVTVDFRVRDDFYMLETQVHVGDEILPRNETDNAYITDPNNFELVNSPSQRYLDSHFLRGCQEDNWISARAVVCGPFDDPL